MDVATATIQKAAPGSTAEIVRLINSYSFASGGNLLPVSHDEILKRIRNEAVYISVDNGRVIAVGSIVEYGNAGNGGEAEFRSLFVEPAYRNQDIGSAILNLCVELATERGYSVLHTYAKQGSLVGFYKKAGFAESTKTPLKLANDCAACPINDRCEEISLELRLAK